MPDDPIPALREAIRRHQAAPARADAAPLPVAPAIDALLPGGGLCRGAVHEVFAADAGAATGFAALLAGRTGGTVLWLAPARAPRPYPPGLAAFGLDPARLLVAEAEATDLLWAAEEALRSTALAALVVLGAAPDLTAGRRLQLAAEAGGVLGLLLGPQPPRPRASAAHTRWRIAALPGAPGPAHALAPPRWRIELLRARGGLPACFAATWQCGELAGVERLAA